MQIGEIIPDTLGTNADGQLITAKDNYANTPLIVYFYPKDNTPGCTAEACSIRDGFDELREKGYAVIGISRDSAASHKRFAEKYSLPFTILTDATGEVCEAFGVWKLKKMAGREYMGLVRTTFITDANHVLTHIITKVKIKDAANQILDLIAGKPE